MKQKGLKKFLKWTGIAVATPVALFLLLAVAVYLPPVQQFIKNRVTSYLSDKTGMKISIERVALAFPLDLSVNGMLATEGPDTLVAAKSLRLCIRFRPLLDRRIDVSGFELWRAQIDSKSYISDTHIKGYVGMLGVAQPAIIDLLQKHIDVHRMELRNADIGVILSDTARKDTSQTKTTWLIALQEADLRHTAIRVRMPGDSMRVGADIGSMTLRGGRFDLGEKDYRVRLAAFRHTDLSYDIPQARAIRGLDYNHLALHNVEMRADTLRYAGGHLAVGIPWLGFQEKSGLKLDKLQGQISLDTMGVTLPVFHLATPYTRLDATARLQWKALKPHPAGRMELNLKGHVGRHDVLLLAGQNAGAILPYYPNTPLLINAQAAGNTNYLTISHLSATLAPIHLEAYGHVGRIMSNKGRYGTLVYRLRTGNLAFYTKALPASLRKRISIPKAMQMAGDVTFSGDRYGTHSTLHVGRGSLAVNGRYDVSAQAYEARLLARRFPLYAFLPKDSLSGLTAALEAKGRGFDFLSHGTTTSAKAHIRYLSYGHIPLDSTQMDAHLSGGHGILDLKASNRLMTGTTHLTADILKREVRAALQANIEDLAFEQLTRGKDSTHLMMNIQTKAYASTKGERYGADGNISSINLITTTKGFPVKDIDFSFHTAKDSTHGYIDAGDLTARLASKKVLSQLVEDLANFSTRFTKQLKEAQLNQNDLKRYLPDMSLYLKAGQDNPIARYLLFRGYKLDSVFLDLTTNQTAGVSGKMEMMALKTGNLLLDRTTATITQDTSGIHVEGDVYNTSAHNPNRFTAQLMGHVLSDGFSLQTIFKDYHQKEGLNFGVRAQLKDGGLTLHLFPETSVIAYRKFKVNKDNYLTIDKDKFIQADIDLLADDQTGLKINTTPGDSTRDLTVSVSHLNLDELSSVVPYMPRMGGLMSGDIHVVREPDKNLSAVAALEVQAFRYEGCELGNIGVDAIYLPKSLDEHYVNAQVTSEGREVCQFDGTYYNKGEGSIDATVDLEKFPCHLLDGFMTADGTVGLLGRAGGELTVKGPVSKPIVNGQLMPDSLYICSNLYGVNLRVENKPITITDSRLHLDDLSMYSEGKNPLVVKGDVDFSRLDLIRLDLGIKASNFEFVNSQRKKESVVFGKVFADLDATLKGTTSSMVLRGNLSVLDNTNMTYVMTDTPLSVEDRLSGLVEFTNFADTTTQTTPPVPPAGGVFVSLGVHVSDAARLHCELSPDGDSYLDCEGGGDLTMKYFPSGEISLMGRFTMNDGEMKYALPFIPLKIFKFTGDNYIRFTGDPMNPMLHITAMETTRASVSDDNTSTRMVTFRVGVAITNSLSKMGLQFLIEAPEDLEVQNQLAAISTEERGKLAVSMLATGMYLSTQNKSSFKANNALNAFLQNEIQNLAGNALKTIDLTVGVEGSTTQSGQSQTDYSFQFAKHFWNDRVTFIIGGKVSTGASDNTNQSQSFIDNISLEYRLDKGSSRYMRLFYDHDTRDPLEGLYSSAGAGLVLRRKTNNLGELFIFRSKKKADEKQLPQNASKK